MLDTTAEAQIAASDGQRLIIYPRLDSDRLRWQFNDARARGLTVLAVALFNTRLAYGWRQDLQSKTWMNQALEMQRRPGEYRGTQHAVIKPAREQVYTIDEFRRAFCLPVARIESS